MGNFRDYLNEARNTSVPTEFRIALGQLKRMYNDGEVPEKKELLKDVEMIAKKNHLDSDKFLEFALVQFKMNESIDISKVEEAVDKKFLNIIKDTKIELIKFYDSLNQLKIQAASKTKPSLEIEAQKMLDNITTFKARILDKYEKEAMNESAVGTPGRTTVKDAEDHINDELLAEFKKIIKKLGGKTVAKVLLDKLGQKAEIKDEIDHIEDIIDNSNY